MSNQKKWDIRFLELAKHISMWSKDFDLSQEMYNEVGIEHVYYHINDLKD